MLLRVRGVNKYAFNSQGKTPLEVAREVTDYHESFRIIEKLTDHASNILRPFMYCAPELSEEKLKRAKEKLNKSFDDKRNTELVVAALLATMTFTAILTVPGGVYQDKDQGILGSPILIDFTTFKLFIIFDCIAFILSLLVCIMWQIPSELTKEDNMFFMTISSLLTCLSFGFTFCGFMAVVYTILAYKEKTLAWLLLGNLLLIALCGAIACINQWAMFAVARARFHSLCGVMSQLDNIVEAVWQRAEHSGFLNIIRRIDETSHDAVEGDEQEHGYNCSCSSTPCLRNISQSV